jgi:hypothetical protein
MLDYKDVTFSFRDRKARGRRRLLCLFLSALAVLAALAGYRCLRARAAVNAIQDLLLAGRLDEAGQRLREAGSPVFQRGNLRELRALSDLFAGRLGEAAAQLEELGRERAATTLRSGQMLSRFLDQGRYRELKLYGDYLLPRGSDEVRWFHALCQAAFLDGGGSRDSLAGLSAAFRAANGKAVALLSDFDDALAGGRIDYVFDRNDLPLACFDLKRRESRSLLPGISFPEFAARFREGARFFRLTLDGALQRKVDRLFSGYFGSLVLLDLPENGIAVAYSKPRSGSAANAAFAERFQPGSIVKLVALLAYLRHGGAGVFPLDCRGLLPVAGRIIYDLRKHGRVRDVARALALSCNVSFARMAQETGPGELVDLLQRFLFNGPPIRDQFCSFATGKFDLPAGDAFRLAGLAAGLDGVTVTTLHAAVLAAIFAQRGQYAPPYLIDGTKNILGLGFYRHVSRPQRLLTDDLEFLHVQKAMAAVVEDEEGTGRRLRGAAVRLAIKTGTARGPAGGLDAIIAGFFPYEKPRYAFAFRLEGGGRAESNGASFLGGLLEILYPE